MDEWTTLSKEAVKTLIDFVNECEISDDIMDRYQQDRCKTYLKALIYEAKYDRQFQAISTSKSAGCALKILSDRIIKCE